MFIVYIVFGIASGIIAAIVTLLSGSGFLAALMAYAVAGIIGMVAAMAWAMIPRQSHAAERPATQQS